jgi:plastocyanin
MRFKRRPWVIHVAASFFLIWAAAGCSTAGDLAKEIVTEPGRSTVTITASSFKFEPAVIEAQRGAALTLEIVNVASAVHNFTIKDPNDQVLRSVDLPPKETVTLEIALQESGTYEFYCDLPFHATLGMKGKIEVKGGR